MIEKRATLWAALCTARGAEIKEIGRVRGTLVKAPDQYRFEWSKVTVTIAAGRARKAAAFTSKTGSERLGTVPLLGRLPRGEWIEGDKITLDWKIKFEGSGSVH